VSLSRLTALSTLAIPKSLHVAVDHVVPVCVVQCRGDLLGDPNRVGDRDDGLTPEALAQGAAAHVRHHVVQEAVGFAGVEQREDVGVVELCGDSDLAQEPVGSYGSRQVGLEHLDCHRALVLAVLGEVHGGHATASEFMLDGVAVRECGPDSVNHPGAPRRA
jgi:hypothetical protein